MAKKKKKSAEAKEAKPAKKEEKGRYITGIVIAIIVIVVLILLFRACTKSASAPVQPTAPQTPVTPATPGPVSAGEKPQEIKMCPIDNGIGYVPGTCAISADSVALTLKGQGVAGIEGVWFYMTDADGKVNYWKDTTSGKQDANVVFNVPAKNVAEMLALPMKDGKACFNQRIVVVKAKNCIN
jgi:hypothetical protein